MLPKLMPAIFFGHGNPMNALCSNAFTKSWVAIGAKIPSPKAILCISAHWYIPATFVTAVLNSSPDHYLPLLNIIALCKKTNLIEGEFYATQN